MESALHLALVDLLECHVDMVFGNFLDDTRAKVLIADTFTLGWSSPTLLEVLYVLVDAYLFTHDTGDVDFVWIVVILDQGCLDGFLETAGIYWEVSIRDETINLFLLAASFCGQLRGRLGGGLRDRHFLPLLVKFVSFHLVGFGNDLPMGACRWEAVHVLFDLVSKDV